MYLRLHYISFYFAVCKSQDCNNLGVIVTAAAHKHMNISQKEKSKYHRQSLAYPVHSFYCRSSVVGILFSLRF